MKQQYQPAVLIVTTFDVEDVITTSTVPLGGNPENEIGHEGSGSAVGF